MAAETWHGYCFNAPLPASTGCVFDIFNQAPSGKTIKIYRMWALNNSSASYTGVLCFLTITRIDSAVGGTLITPIPHDTINAALDTFTSLGTGRTVNSTATFRRILYSLDEPLGTGNESWDLLLCFVPFAEIWNSGYGDDSVEPIACRSGFNEGLSVNRSTGVSSASVIDGEIEFTSE